MTISTETCQVIITGNDATTEFNYSFLIPYQDDGVTPAVTVVLIDNAEDPPTRTTLVLDTDYSISGVNDPDGGVVTYDPGTPIPATKQIEITRSLDYTQGAQFLNQGFLPETIEDLGDRLTMMIQQLNTRLTALE